MSKIRAIVKESDLCAVFIQEFNAVPGWVCYPETAGFDILVVHESGRQIGVEAKLTLNAKVADQILPEWCEEFYGRAGPDHRLVIVSKITDANAGISKMLERLGVTVLCPTKRADFEGDYFTFGLEHQLLQRDKERTYFMEKRLFDWWPSDRCKVPMAVPNLPAGVPAPIKLTPWKESALKVIALMRSQGFITSKQITSHGIGITSWTQSPGSKPAWLARGTVRGQWTETEHMPAFDKQHPEVYELAVASVAALQDKPLELAL